jgi:hypothetical protein
MNKIERVRAALAGRPVDRAPFTVWYHFGNQHAPAEQPPRCIWSSSTITIWTCSSS